MSPPRKSDTELIGQVFGRLTVEACERSNEKHRRWFCRCQCGALKSIRHDGLTSGNTQSCGCLNREIRKRGPISRITHGHSGNHQTPTYKTWHKMKQRCLNPKDDNFANYGDRGITVCEQWLKFEGFLSDMGERPPGTSIDRFPDKNGNYEPGNCRWATAREQCNNMRKNVVVEFQGESLTVAEWSRRWNMPPHVLSSRLKLGWTMERARSELVHKPRSVCGKK